MKHLFTIALLSLVTWGAQAQLAKNHQKFLGNILKGFKNNPMTADPDFLTYWNQATPENAGKHGLYETSRDVYEWQALDEMYAYCQANNIPFKQHTFLFWCCGADADWLLDLTDAEIRAEMEEWIIHFFNRYPNTAVVEVVNEPFQSPPPAQIINALGGSNNYAWVRWMYEKARQHAPAGCELWINENNVLKGGSRVTSYMNMINLLKQDGNIDGIGVQGHWLESIAASTIQNTLNQLDDLGIPIYITEYDVSVADDADQQSVWAAQFPVMWEHPAVKGVTLWGYKQGQIWRSNAYLVRSDGSERPALVWLRNYLNKTGSSLNLEAEDHNAQQGVTTYPEFIGYVDANDWIRFDNVDLKNGFNTITMHYARGATGDRFAEVRLGSVTGTKIAELSAAGTGGWNTFVNTSATVSGGSGVQTVYIVFKGGASCGNFDWFRFSDPKSGSTIKVYAAGKDNTESMALRINGTTVQTWTNISGNAGNRVFTTYTYNHPSVVSAAQVRVAFTNDNTARDLRVDKIEIDGVAYESEASSTWSTGTWRSSDACAGGYKQSEWLHCSGYFAYENCSGCRSTVMVEEQPGDEQGMALRVYPNPTADRLTIVSEDPLVQLSLQDAAGRSLMDMPTAGREAAVELGGLGDGFYLLKVKTSKRLLIRKVIVKR